MRTDLLAAAGLGRSGGRWPGLLAAFAAFVAVLALAWWRLGDGLPWTLSSAGQLPVATDGAGSDAGNGRQASVANGPGGAVAAQPAGDGGPLSDRTRSDAAASEAAAAGNEAATARAASAAAPHASSSVATRPLSTWLSEAAADGGLALVLDPEVRGDLAATPARSAPWKDRLEAYAGAAGLQYRIAGGLLLVVRAPERGFGGHAAGSRLPAFHSPARASIDGDAVGGSQEREEAAAGSGSDAVGASTGDHASQDAGTDDAAGAALSGAQVSAGECAAGSPRTGGPGRHGAQGPTTMPSLSTRVLPLANAPAKETAAVLAAAARAAGVVVGADATSNALLLSGDGAGIARFASLAASLDRPARRIAVEARIVEVTRSARLELGIEWKLASSHAGGEAKFPITASDAGSAALTVATGGAVALDARLSAMEAGGRLRVVSRPSVLVLEGHPAVIESARILRIRLPGRGDVVGDKVVESPSSGRATEEIPVGVRLEVTPAARSGGRVLLKVKAKSSSLGAPLPPDDIPEELSRMVEAELLLASGETVVLGGLSRESGTGSGSGLPALRRVPGVGALFGKRSDASEQEELLVLVTPRLLDD